MLLYVCHISRAFFFSTHKRLYMDCCYQVDQCSNQEDFAFYSLPYCLNCFIWSLFSLKNKGLILQERTLYWAEFWWEDEIISQDWGSGAQIELCPFPVPPLPAARSSPTQSPPHVSTCSSWVRAAVHFGDFLHLASGRHLSVDFSSVFWSMILERVSTEV